MRRFAFKADDRFGSLKRDIQNNLQMTCTKQKEKKQKTNPSNSHLKPMFEISSNTRGRTNDGNIHNFFFRFAYKH